MSAGNLINMVALVRMMIPVITHATAPLTSIRTQPGPQHRRAQNRA